MNQQFKISPGSVAGDDDLIVDPSGTTSTAATRSSIRVVPAAPPANKNVENAVYGHIRAVRALGRTEILPSEIAAALSIPLSNVIEALTALQSKGVKFSK